MPELTKQRVHEVLQFESDTGRFYWRERPRDEFSRTCCWASWNVRCAGKLAGCLMNGGRKIVIDNEPYLAHHLVWFLAHGTWVEFLEHTDGHADHNWLSNLVETTPVRSMRSTGVSARNKSGVRGVHKRILRSGSVRWQAVMWDGKRQRSLGHFRSEQEAIAARKKAERKHGYRERPPLHRFKNQGSAKMQTAR